MKCLRVVFVRKNEHHFFIFQKDVGIKKHVFVTCMQLERVTGWRDKIKQLRKILNVSSLEILDQEDLFVHCRTSSSIVPKQTIIQRNAWITLGMNIVKQQAIAPYHRLKLEQMVDDLRKNVISIATLSI